MLNQRGSRKSPPVQTKADDPGSSGKKRGFRLSKDVEGIDFKAQELDEPYLPDKPYLPDIWPPRKTEYPLWSGA